MGSHQAFLGHGLEGVYILCDQMIDAFESFSALSSCLLFFCYLFIYLFILLLFLLLLLLLLVVVVVVIVVSSI
jgi:hypothetical protein